MRIFSRISSGSSPSRSEMDMRKMKSETGALREGVSSSVPATAPNSTHIPS